MREQGSKNATEDERRRAVLMVVEQNVPAEIVAQTLGRAKDTVESWVRKSDYGRDLSALHSAKQPGAKRKLTASQQEALLQILEAGPTNAGFDDQLWTGPRIALVIKREFGVTYHDRYVSALLRSLGWSVQKPKRRAVERDDEKVAVWQRKDWPRIKKNSTTRRNSRFPR